MTVELKIKIRNKWKKWIVEEVKRIEYTRVIGNMKYAIIETPYSCYEWGFEELIIK